MNEFLLLFRGSEQRMAHLSADEIQVHMQKWMVWMQSLANQGKMVGGLPLKEEGKVVASTKKIVTDGPFAEGKEVVVGYLIVKAQTLEEAAMIAKDCPISEHNGSTEVRELRPLPQ